MKSEPNKEGVRGSEGGTNEGQNAQGEILKGRCAGEVGT